MFSWTAAPEPLEPHFALLKKFEQFYATPILTVIQQFLQANVTTRTLALRLEVLNSEEEKKLLAWLLTNYKSYFVDVSECDNLSTLEIFLLEFCGYQLKNKNLLINKWIMQKEYYAFSLARDYPPAFTQRGLLEAANGNTALARLCYKLAIEKGDIEANFYLACLIYKKTQNLNLTLPFISSALANGCDLANVWLAEQSEAYRPLPEKQLLEAAAIQGNFCALYNLTVTQNAQKKYFIEKYYLTQLLTRDFLQITGYAYNDLGNLYYHGNLDKKIDAISATFYYCKTLDYMAMHANQFSDREYKEVKTALCKIFRDHFTNPHVCLQILLALKKHDLKVNLLLMNTIKNFDNFMELLNQEPLENIQFVFKKMPAQFKHHLGVKLLVFLCAITQPDTNGRPDLPLEIAEKILGYIVGDNIAHAFVVQKILNKEAWNEWKANIILKAYKNELNTPPYCLKQTFFTWNKCRHKAISIPGADPVCTKVNVDSHLAILAQGESMKKTNIDILMDICQNRMKP